MNNKAKNEIAEGCGCFLTAVGVGLAIALIVLANAIAGGAVPPFW